MVEGFTLSMEAILTEAVRRQASDTHLTVGLPPMIRVNGDLMPLSSNILTQSDTEYLCKSMLDKARLQYLAERGEVDRCDCAIKWLDRPRHPSPIRRRITPRGRCGRYGCWGAQIKGRSVGAHHRQA